VLKGEIKAMATKIFYKKMYRVVSLRKKKLVIVCA
jgi:hypothetical protein